MNAVKPILGLVLVALAACPAKLAVALFSGIQSAGPPPGPGVVVHHTILLYGHAFTGWRIRVAMAVLAIAAVTLFIAGLHLAFSIVRESK